MKHGLLYTLGLIVLVMVTFAASPANAQTTAAGPYYATPSWDQTLACTTTSNCPRFIVLSNMGSAAVLDRETGLVWEKNPLHPCVSSPPISICITPETGKREWDDAQKHCRGLTVGGRMGWRLPTVEELASLVDPNNPDGNPDLPPGHPFLNVQSDYYWSATTYHYFSDEAFFVHFGGVLGVGYVLIGSKINGDYTRNYVWCVRGGQGVDPQ